MSGISEQAGDIVCMIECANVGVVELQLVDIQCRGFPSYAVDKLSGIAMHYVLLR